MLQEIQNTVGENCTLGTNQSAMREGNERLVLSILRRISPLSRQELSRITGLTAPTISMIIRKLNEECLLVSDKPTRGQVGQPPIPLQLAADGAYFLGLIIGRREASVVLVDFLGGNVGQHNISYRYPNPVSIINFATRSSNNLTRLLELDKQKRISGFGVAMPFRLWDWSFEIGISQDKLKPWADLNIGAELGNALGYPVQIENDASAACAAQLVFGQNILPGNFLYLHIDYFIGGGLVLNGNLYTGYSGNAGALGSMPTVNKHGKRKQLVEVASLSNLAEMHIAEGMEHIDQWQLIASWNIRDDLLDKWLKQTISAIADTVTASASVIDFEAVIIDGRIPEALRQRMVEDLRLELTLQNFAGIEVPKVLEGTIGADAPMIGAASLPLRSRYLVDNYALLPKHW